MAPNRRDFIKQTAAAAAGLSLGLSALGMKIKNGLPYRKLGKTGLDVSLLNVGGSHIGRNNLTDQESVTLIRTAIDEGINFLDNAWEYNDGRSEERMGKALQDGYRDKVFLMTKHHGREPKRAQKHLEDSLRRFKTDVIDVWQFHELDEHHEVDEIYSSGVLDFALRAKEQGKIRFIGFTGHYLPEIHLDMINRGFEWDTVQMPINPLDHHYLSFTQHVLPVAVEKNIGVIGMKSLAGNAVLVNKGAASVEECLRFAMTMPISTLCSGMETVAQLKQNIETTRNFTPLTEGEIADLLNRSLNYAQGGENEGYKGYETNKDDNW
ncbi:MAG: twin-arginine translocation signal domain-containing protein [Bacteroidetes bacterium]|jgi:predicted aldo/keto reductase-like oxidoreductase|nr:twin-arginine translocation signal domain-containing protein [Bacteroidota bacterium]